MGGTESSEPFESLPLAYDGEVGGLLKAGVILTNCGYGRKSLDSSITKILFESVSPVAQLQVTQSDDLPGKKFELSIQDPTDKNYRPFFFDRKSEYGQGHVYLEGLCHALPQREIIFSSTARYFKKTGTAILTPHPPVTWPMLALVECIRKINGDFLRAYKEKLDQYQRDQVLDSTKMKIEPEDVDDLVNGAFRNVAVQIHYGGKTRDRTTLIHMDHVFSCLHMGVTVHGTRALGFVIGKPDEFEKKIVQNEGDIYLTCPAGILHGVSLDEQTPESEMSMALQCRTLLSGHAAQAWTAHKFEVCTIVTEVLRKNVFHLPSKELFHATLAELTQNAGTNLPNITMTYETKD